jgi:hypothetical protein
MASSGGNNERRNRIGSIWWRGSWHRMASSAAKSIIKKWHRHHLWRRRSENNVSVGGNHRNVALKMEMSMAAKAINLAAVAAMANGESNSENISWQRKSWRGENMKAKPWHQWRNGVI